MIKRHREQRSVTRERECKKSYHKIEKVEKTSMLKNNQLGQGHGVKRSVSHSWEGDNQRVSKHKHQNGHNSKENLINQNPPRQIKATPVNERFDEKTDVIYLKNGIIE